MSFANLIFIHCSNANGPVSYKIEVRGFGQSAKLLKAQDILGQSGSATIFPSMQLSPFEVGLTHVEEHFISSVYDFVAEWRGVEAPLQRTASPLHRINSM